MKKPQLKAGMDCTNLRTRAGTRVLNVFYSGKLTDYPFLVYYVSVDGMQFDSHFVGDGSYWLDSQLDSQQHKYDILELEEGDEGYVGEGEEEGVELDDSIDGELKEVLNSSLSATLKIKLIKLILTP